MENDSLETPGNLENLHRSSTDTSSSFHFNSFLGLLTSDDDDDGDDGNDIDQDAYIEIALELPQPEYYGADDGPLVEQEEELQARVSFSGTSKRVFPFPGFSSLPSAMWSSAARAYGTTSSKSCPDDNIDKAIGLDNSYTQGTAKIRFQAAANLLRRFFPSTLNISTTKPICSWEWVGRRGEVSMTDDAGRTGVVGNFLVKLRAKTFQMMMASLLKLRQFTSSALPEKMNRRDICQLKPRKKQMLLVKPFKKLFEHIQSTQRGVSSSKIGGNTIQRSRVINIISSKGSQEGDGHGGLNSSSKGREKKTKSCPASVQSSPTKEQSQNIHFARDNSVQAAIAHCKKSLGRSDEFSFLI